MSKRGNASANSSIFFFLNKYVLLINSSRMGVPLSAEPVYDVKKRCRRAREGYHKSNVAYCYCDKQNDSQIQDHRSGGSRVSVCSAFEFDRGGWDCVDALAPINFQSKPKPVIFH